MIRRKRSAKFPLEAATFVFVFIQLIRSLRTTALQLKKINRLKSQVEKWCAENWLRAVGHTHRSKTNKNTGTFKNCSFIIDRETIVHA